MSTDLLANSSDPDFMYELDREMNYQQNPRDSFLSLEDCKDIENLESFTDVLDNEGTLTSNWEQWDTYCEDLTKYTKLTSCDIWGTKEVDYLGLDDFSSPYQDEEVISKTPTLAQLNSEDSQSVSDSLYYPDSLFSVKQNPLPSSFPGKKLASRAAAPVCSSKILQAEVPLSDCVQKASKPTSSTQIMVKTNMHHTEKVNFHVECKDYVKKAKVKINPVQQSRPLLSQVHADAAKENTCYCGVVAKRPERKGRSLSRVMPLQLCLLKKPRNYCSVPCPRRVLGQLLQERVAAFLPAHRSQIHPRKKKSTIIPFLSPTIWVNSQPNAVLRKRRTTRRMSMMRTMMKDLAASTNFLKMRRKKRRRRKTMKMTRMMILVTLSLNQAMKMIPWKT